MCFKLVRGRLRREGYAFDSRCSSAGSWCARMRVAHVPKGTVPHSQDDGDQHDGDEDYSNGTCRIQHPVD